MPFNQSHVQYVLAQFDAGVPPHKILLELQYRDFLPSINIATIERCLRDNGRVLRNQQAGNPTQGNQPIGIGYGINALPLANQGATGSSAATQGSGQFHSSSAMRTVARADDHFAGPGPNMPWDAQADDLAFAAVRDMKSEEEIWIMLRGRGYDVSRAQVVARLARQVR